MKTRTITGMVVIGALALTAFSTSHKKQHRGVFFHSEPTGIIYLVVTKSKYELQVFDDDGWYATYPVVFGNKDVNDKMVEGDRKTPEGTFRIVSKKPHNKWHKMFLLDYPTQESWDKFNERKAQGVIPKNAKIGNGIAIHGTWPHDELVVDDFTNWTNGCVSLKNEDIDELDPIIPVGTKVIIKR